MRLCFRRRAAGLKALGRCLIGLQVYCPCGDASDRRASGLRFLVPKRAFRLLSSIPTGGSPSGFFDFVPVRHPATAANGRRADRSDKKTKNPRPPGFTGLSGVFITESGDYLLLLLLFLLRGFTISRQSRSPRSSARTRISPVAMFVATGMLYISQRRSSSISVRVGSLVSLKKSRRSTSLYAMRCAICSAPPCEPAIMRSIYKPVASEMYLAVTAVPQSECLLSIPQ